MGDHFLFQQILSDASEMNSANYTRYCLYFTNHVRDELVAILYLDSIQMSHLLVEFDDLEERIINNEFFDKLAREIYDFVTVKLTDFVGGFTFRSNYIVDYVRIMSPDVFKEESKCGRLRMTEGFYY